MSGARAARVPVPRVPVSHVSVPSAAPSSVAGRRRPATTPRPRTRRQKDSELRVLVSGASGLIGTELVRQLEADGHTVLRLVRRQPETRNEVNWAPTARILDFTLLDSVDAVVNLSGTSLAHLPWTARYKKEILSSRIESTHALTDAMRMASSPPPVFLSASAVGVYGDRPGERLTESSARGDGFLAEVVEAWEAAAHLAPEKTRVVTFRSGVVLGDGGALGRLELLTKLGLAGPLGTGGQHWPWVSLHDEAAAIRHLLTSQLSGPVNVVGPTPATADRIMKRLAKDLRRPYGLAVPERLITLALREAGHELLLASQKVSPVRLLSDGFVFRHEKAEQAVDWMVSGQPAPER
ncbi:TIGR01777 family oxidoreductase [Luethyella okanaganae]|uniref:TIGR01777 family oxidoreductase n=1 Tax=Luethyella okanaganae TaxID=69372 RepID=A0ABW1VJS4_9MICO